MKMHLRYLAAAGSLAATVGLLAACGTSQAPAPGGGHSGSPPIASRGPSPGLVPAPRQLSDRIVLQRTTVKAGSPIKGTLVVVNRGHTKVNLTRGCRPAYAVVLTNHRFPPNVAFPADCSTRPFLIKPGVTRLAVSVITTYPACTQNRGEASDRTPACQHGNRMPPLPPGPYRAVLVGSGNLPLPPPIPVQVVLTAP